jgi:hypothetical protein
VAPRAELRRRSMLLISGLSFATLGALLILSLLLNGP